MKTKMIEVCDLNYLLAHNYGNVAKTARDLGVERRTIYAWIKKGAEKVMLKVTRNDSEVSFSVINKWGE